MPDPIFIDGMKTIYQVHIDRPPWYIRLWRRVKAWWHGRFAVQWRRTDA